MPPPTTWSTPLFDAQTPQGGEDGDFDDGGLGSGAADFSEPDDGLPEGGCNCRSRDIVSETQPDDSDSLSFGFQCETCIVFFFFFPFFSFVSSVFCKVEFGSECVPTSAVLQSFVKVFPVCQCFFFLLFFFLQFSLHYRTSDCLSMA
jgi:hypothetical protein